MTGLIHCEYGYHSFDIGYFNDNSSSTSILVIKVKKAILTKLNKLNNHKPCTDVRLINKNNGLEYFCDNDYIKTNSIITIKLKPTNLARMKYYENKVNINDIIILNPCAQKSVYKNNNKEKPSLSIFLKEERIKKIHNGLGSDLLPIGVEDEIEHKTLSTKEISRSPSTSYDDDYDNDNDRILEIEEQQMKILKMLQKREELEKQLYEEEMAKMYYYYGSRYHLRKRGRNKNHNKKHKYMNRREFGDYMMKKFDPNNYIPSFSFTEYKLNPSNPNDIKIDQRSKSRVPALSFLQKKNKPKSNPFDGHNQFSISILYCMLYCVFGDIILKYKYKYRFNVNILYCVYKFVCCVDINININHNTCMCCCFNSNSLAVSKNSLQHRSYGSTTTTTKNKRKKRSRRASMEQQGDRNTVDTTNNNYHNDFNFNFSQLNNVSAPLIKRRKL